MLRHFADRVDAGRRLAGALPPIEGDVIVLGLQAGTEYLCQLAFVFDDQDSHDKRILSPGEPADPDVCVREEYWLHRAYLTQMSGLRTADLDTIGTGRAGGAM